MWTDWLLSKAKRRQGRELTLNEDCSARNMKSCAAQWYSKMSVFNITELHTKKTE